MAKAKTRARSSSLGFFLVLLLLVLGAAAAVGTIYLANDFKLPFFSRVQAKDDNTAGKIKVPSSAHMIAAYTEVKLGDLFDPQTKTLNGAWVDEKTAKEKGFITDVAQIVNRVMAHDKQPNYTFTEADFLPKGTRASPTAGV